MPIWRGDGQAEQPISFSLAYNKITDLILELTFVKLYYFYTGSIHQDRVKVMFLYSLSVILKLAVGQLIAFGEWTNSRVGSSVGLSVVGFSANCPAA